MAHKSRILLCGKRLIGLIRSDAAQRLALPPTFVPLRKGVHTTTYDKNIDEAVVSGDQPDQSYWAPHPHTGVFGPAAGRFTGPTDLTSGARKAAAGNPSVLDQTAWFRPVEGVDKPTPP